MDTKDLSPDQCLKSLTEDKPLYMSKTYVYYDTKTIIGKNNNRFCIINRLKENSVQDEGVQLLYQVTKLIGTTIYQISYTLIIILFNLIGRKMILLMFLLKSIRRVR